MQATAIICEYNPMTNGHLHHLKKAREETNADTLIAVMSGSFTQRGDAAIADKYQRAAVAARLGFDLVLELPTVFSVSPADNFAYGAMKIIASIPAITCVSFGSECGDIEKLTKVADLLTNEPKEISEDIEKYLDEGCSFPRARAAAVNNYLSAREEMKELVGIIDSPNNILGLAYIVAAKKLNANIKFHTITRMGGGYNDTSIETAFPSASAIREAALQGKLSEIASQVPPYTYTLLQNCSFSKNSLGDLILFRIKELGAAELATFYDVTGGLHNRLKIAAETSNTFEQYLESAKTKKYTLAKIKRVSLYALLNITKDLYNLALESDPYLFILALNKERKDILTYLSENCKNVLIRYSDIDKVDKTLRPLIKLDFTAQGLLGLINHSNYYNKKMVLV